MSNYFLSLFVSVQVSESYGHIRTQHVYLGHKRSGKSKIYILLNIWAFLWGKVGLWDHYAPSVCVIITSPQADTSRTDLRSRQQSEVVHFCDKGVPAPRWTR